MACRGVLVVVVVVMMMILLACAVSISAERSWVEEQKDKFDSFIHTYGKAYPSLDEYQTRFRIFTNNLARIEQLNEGTKSARFGVTKFADLTASEFKRMYLNRVPYNTQGKIKVSRSKRQTSFLPSSVVPVKLEMSTAIPAQFDWRAKGAVTPTKDQGQCGSCWAFSVTEAIESQWFLAGHSLPVLSPQQIVDCDKGDGNYGCSGGDTPTAYEYVIKAGGLDTEASYPYLGEDGTCKFQPDKVAAKISNWTYITATKNETEMQVGLYTRGPLSICVEADSWQFYVGGVISDFCGQNLDHCVMITGYGVQKGWDFENYDVWVIRNSWGEDWGYGGYLYVERGYNLCGVADEVTIPLV